MCLALNMTLEQEAGAFILSIILNWRNDDIFALVIVFAVFLGIFNLINRDRPVKKRTQSIGGQNASYSPGNPRNNFFSILAEFGDLSEIFLKKSHVQVRIERNG
jgi:hypothetical protein